VSEFSEFLPPGEGSPSKRGEFDDFLPPAGEEAKPSLAVGLWDRALGVVDRVNKSMRADEPVADIKPPEVFAQSPPGISPEQEKFDTFLLDSFTKKGKTVELDNHLRQMEARGYKISRPLAPTAPTIAEDKKPLVPEYVPPDAAPDAFGMVPLAVPELKAAGASVASFPGDLLASSIAGLTGLTELATGGGLQKAGKTIEKTAETLSPSAAVRPLMSPETQAAQERQMTAIGAMFPPGGVVAQAAEALGMDEKYAPLVEGAINLAAIGGPTAVAIAKPSVLNSNWYRKLTIKERGLVLMTVDQMKASGMTEAQIIRIRPEEWQKAFEKRGGGQYAEKPPVPPIEPPPVESPAPVETAPGVPARVPPTPPGATISPKPTPTPLPGPIVTPATTAAPGIPSWLADELRREGTDPSSVHVIKSSEEHREYFRKYGIPNAVGNEDGTPRFGKGSSLFVDDDTGKIVAYSPEEFDKKGKPIDYTKKEPEKAGPVAVPEPEAPTPDRTVRRPGEPAGDLRAGDVLPSEQQVEQSPKDGKWYVYADSAEVAGPFETSKEAVLSTGGMAKLSTGIPQAETIRTEVVDALEKNAISLSQKDEFGSIPVKGKLTTLEQQELVKRGITFDTDRMGNPVIRLSLEKRRDNLRKKVAGTPPAEPPVQTPGEKFAKVRDIKSKQKQKAMEQTPVARVRKGGGIRWTEDIAGEIRTYASRKEGGNKATALQMLFRRQEKNPKGYAGAMAWDKWIQTFQEDGTLPKDAGIADLFDLLLENKKGMGAGIRPEEVTPTEPELEKIKEREAAAAKEDAAAAEEKVKQDAQDEKDAAEERAAIQAEAAGEFEEPKGQPFKLDTEEAPVAEAPLKPEMAGEQDELFPGERSKYRAPEKGAPLPPPEGGLFGKKQDMPPKGAYEGNLGMVKALEHNSGRKFPNLPTEEQFNKSWVDRVGKEEGVSASDVMRDLIVDMNKEPTAEDIVDVPGMGGDEAGFQPQEGFRKEPAEPRDTDKPMSRSEIAKFLAEKFDIPLRVGRFRNALGIFKVKAEVIRTKLAHDIEVIAHEIGHALHKHLWPDARTSSGGLSAGPLRPFQDELIPIATKPRAGGSKTAEGFAEFIRKYVVDEAEARRVAPKFYKFFEEKLDADSPDTKAILLKARADYKMWLEQPPLARVMGSISQTPELKSKLSGGELYTALVDALYPLEKVIKEMAKVNKIDLVPSRWNAYKLAHLMAGWKGKADAWLEYKPFSFKTYKFSSAVKSFREIMLPVKDNREKLDAYLVSRRSLKVGQDKSGILNADAQAVIEQMEREHPEFKQAAIDLKHYQNALLRYLYDGGVINGEQFLQMRESNEDYVPFYRVMDYEQSGAWGKTGYEVTRAPLHRFKGSWRDIVSPTESIIKNTYAFINAVEKNAVGKALVDLSNQSEGQGKYVEKIPADTQRIAVRDTELEDMLRKYGKWTETTQFTTTNQAIRETITETGDTGEAVPPDERGTRIMKERAVEALKTRGYSEAESRTIVDRIARATNTTARNRIVERVIERATVRATVKEFGIEIPEGLAYIYRPSKQTPRGNVITVMIKGKPTFYEVDPRIYKAFHALDRESANTIIKIMAIPARLLRAGATLTPEFALGKNPFRDQWTAFINSKYGYKPHFDFARGIFSAVKQDKAYWQWKIGGGEHAAMVSMDRESLDKNWKEIMRAHGVKEGAFFVVTEPIDALRAVSEFTEGGTRIGEFKAGLRQLGNSKEAIQESAYASREVTLPFSRMGSTIKAWNMITAFIGANIADLDKIHRQFKEYPKQTTVRLIATITIPSILLAWATHDDDDIKEVAQWQKDIFWIFPTGRTWTSGPWAGDKVLIRIPKPFVLGTLFGTFPERITRYILNKDPHAMDGFVNSMIQGVVPPILPTGIVPPIENWANRSMFTDRAIVPKAREGVLPEYQYQPYTTETAKKIGGLLAKIPGIRETALASQIVSPAGIENLVRGYSGGLGVWALHAADKGLQLAGIVPKRVEPTKALSDYPLMKAFVVRYPTSDTESIKRFFDDYSEAEKNIKSAKLMYKRGDVKEALAIIKENNLAKVEGFKTALTNAHRLVDSVYENPNIKPDEKRRIIDQTYLHMTAMAKAGNKLMDLYKAERSRKTPEEYEDFKKQIKAVE